jgi:hypothetical protein
MAFDLKDFFESLDHKRLKQKWKRILNVLELPADHYSVFKAVTKYAWVERDALFKHLGITRTKQSSWRGPICTPKQFREQVRTKDKSTSLVKTRIGAKGVPQGSAISALLSNLYMMDVDKRLASLAETKGGLYRRYSDDILIVCHPDEKTEMENELRKQMISELLSLHDGPGKFTTATFQLNTKGDLTSDRPLQYFGIYFRRPTCSGPISNRG